MFDFPLPFNRELKELRPYRTNKTLKDKIDYIFRHPSNPYNNLFVEVSTSGTRGLLNDMSTIAVASCRHFLLNKQQYGNSLDNIHMQILVKMWKQTFKHCAFQEKELDKYYATKVKLSTVENGFIEHLLLTCTNEDYIQSGDDMVKEREAISRFTNRKVSKRERISHGTHEGGDLFEYLVGLD